MDQHQQRNEKVAWYYTYYLSPPPHPIHSLTHTHTHTPSHTPSHTLSHTTHTHTLTHTLPHHTPHTHTHTLTRTHTHTPHAHTLTHTHTPSHTPSHTPLTGAQPVTQRVCPNCEESCHIRCKKCPECEHEFPPSTKSRAKPDQDIVKNPSNLLQILQKKVTINYVIYNYVSICTSSLITLYRLEQRLVKASYSTRTKCKPPPPPHTHTLSHTHTHPTHPHTRTG